MPRIFISYRRNDTQGVAGRIYDRLVEAFGKENIFMDVDNIPPGGDFRQVLSEAIAQADVVLLLIGSQWAGIMRKRRNNEHDFVRVELLEAISQRKITIPVLLNTPMPETNCLPRRLHTVFPFLNAVEVDMGANFHRDMTRFIGQLEIWEAMPLPREMPEKPVRPQWVERLIANLKLVAAIILGALVGVGSYTTYLQIFNPTDPPISVTALPDIPLIPTDADIVAYIQSRAAEPTAPVLAEVSGHERTFLALRQEPDSAAEIFMTVRAGTLLIVDGRTWNGQWFTTTFQGQRLWFKSPFVRLMRDGASLAIIDLPLDGRDMGSALDILAVYEEGSRFYDALIAADFGAVLNGDEPLTVFVPPNAAFDALLVEAGITLQDNFALRDLLMPYIMEGQWHVPDLVMKEQAGYLPDGRVQVNGAPIAIPDVIVSNGVIHLLDGVFVVDE